MNKKISDVAKIIFDKIKSESNNIWDEPNCLYGQIRHLQIDKRGSFGERLILFSLLDEYQRRIEYNDGDQGNWDIKINNYKFEIKTSSIDVNNKFQNENIKESGFDGIIFIGVTPNKIYIKCVKHENIPYNKLHNRLINKTGAGYKWDFKVNDMIEVTTTNDVIEIFKKEFNF